MFISACKNNGLSDLLLMYFVLETNWPRFLPIKMGRAMMFVIAIKTPPIIIQVGFAFRKALITTAVTIRPN